MSRKNGSGAATKERKRPRQKYIPGTQPPSIPAIDRACESYREARDARMRLTEREVEAAALLIHQMKEHGQEVYTCDGYTVTLKRLEKVQVRSSQQDKE